MEMKFTLTVLRDLPSAMAIKDCRIKAFEVFELVTIQTIFDGIISIVLDSLSTMC